MKREDVIIYLNEEDEKIYVKVPKGIETHFQLQNLAGKIIQEAIHFDALHDFDLSGLPEGNYFVIVNQDERISTKKIIKGYHP
ncbi:T9SS type A sorting domain-containing protein [Emticicia sp. CRIBPO]|uniref:T9SS type A sorting domain-containing protein n=1 Tax=Emticicia sp. CRIBPO TaxID=2683258 RepID=UPI001412B6B1|nr:T9SS type A sorting domain-containing protein [Emticicia sp. CRIBPO]NBA88562.1 T9SS type A sorting domain-containing protein [Emticicia sp. CRIBPO]